MIVIPISIGTLFGLWLVCGVVYFALAGFAAVFAGVLKLVEVLFGTGPKNASTQTASEVGPSEAKVATIAESLRQIGCPPERALWMAEDIVARVRTGRG